jgi:chemotaxis protein methyltransferase CheR
MIENEITGIIDFLRKARGYDYSGHHPAMLLRRIGSRMNETNAPDIAFYEKFLHTHPEEIDNLIDALTITVSNFFRNPFTFELIERQVIPSLLYAKTIKKENALRIWSAGCATGEEPYSMAILLKEYLLHESTGFDISIFATDLDKKNILHAKKGIYNASSVQDVKLKILNKYFRVETDLYKLLPAIRQMVNFSVYNLLNAENYAPPESVFGAFDIILCRNVLIYYQPDYQEKIFYKLYKSLCPGGYLILGEAETLTERYASKFDEINRIAKVYQKKKV